MSPSRAFYLSSGSDRARGAGPRQCWFGTREGSEVVGAMCRLGVLSGERTLTFPELGVVQSRDAGRTEVVGLRLGFRRGHCFSDPVRPPVSCGLCRGLRGRGRGL